MIDCPFRLRATCALVLLLCISDTIHLALAQEGGSPSKPVQEIELQVRPRTEWRDGYQRVLEPGQSGTLLTLQRTRVTWRYQTTQWEVKLGLQEVREFGDPAGISAGYNSVAASESWGAWTPTDRTRLTVGRQLIAFDSERIVGALNWSQYGRFLDGVRLDQTWSWGSTTGALTWDAPAGLTRLMGHHVWDRNRHRISLLYFGQFHSTLPENITTSGVTWAATTEGPISWTVEGYGQRSVAEVPLAWMGAAEVRYQLSSRSRVLLGMDWLQDDSRGAAFSPFLGTNHRHYGWMDHFYVGVPANGMTNAHAQVRFPLDIGAWQAHGDVRYHRFLSADFSEPLAHEVDAVWVLKPAPQIEWSFGWSVMRAEEGLYAFQNRAVSDSPWQQWGWIELNFQPKMLIQ